MKFLEKNVGRTDKTVRIVAGVALVAAFFMNYFEAPLSYIVLLLGFALLATAALGTCTLYTLLGINTCEAKKGK